MRNVALFTIMVLAGCQSPGDSGPAPGSAAADARIIEDTILWEAELHEISWAPIELEKALTNTSRYTEEGNFYKVNELLTVFGHETLYVGTLGVELVPGPNAVLRGTATSVMEAIATGHGIEFNQTADSYVAELDAYVRLIVAPHPHIDRGVIVIGGYFGP